MSILLDSSVLIAALAPDEDRHEECLALLMKGDCVICAHALLETFSTLTGGKLGMKVDADVVAQLLSLTVIPRVHLVELSAEDILKALRVARKHGVRGGAVYDYVHLVAARKAEVTELYTVNLTDFQALRRQGDPEIRRP
ncbi:type II toxin-antitoxin system VapC family toxin [Prosthecobacter vanneervenii]|uniref:Ribonuclease VapC n=1 Tax=Prosthecobacter vanneervenii TaxID=48466 RepID=A0A7W7YAZ5_9BACT|nr:PIN domain-containing protein [Prosthecobacter vanneervenii]MBB5032667.1 putative nucleic acid-binding protein [Prosthecobacter vanneervenii]